MPSILEISAASFGWRASNSSATRGRPPVMSLVFAASRGVFARSMPGETFMPFVTITMAFVGMSCWSSILFASAPSFPRMTICGCRLVSEVGSTTSVFAPVARSISDLTEMSSSKSTNSTMPWASERTGTECGSHVATLWPALTVAPSSTSSSEPIWRE